jgi:hypothetical protein
MDADEIGLRWRSDKSRLSWLTIGVSKEGENRFALYFFALNEFELLTFDFRLLKTRQTRDR